MDNLFSKISDCHKTTTGTLTEIDFPINLNIYLLYSTDTKSNAVERGVSPPHRLCLCLPLRAWRHVRQLQLHTHQGQGRRQQQQGQYHRGYEDSLGWRGSQKGDLHG